MCWRELDQGEYLVVVGVLAHQCMVTGLDVAKRFHRSMHAKNKKLVRCLSLF